MAGYLLRLFSSVLDGAQQGFVADLTNTARCWRRSIRLQGGYWLGSFELHGDVAYLTQAFYNWLGYHVQERCGGVSWEGLLYEMELTVEGVRRRRSLDLLHNRARVDYTDTAGASQSTAWATVSESVTRYGQKDEIVPFTGGQVGATTAQARRDLELQEYGWPWARPVAIEQPGEPTLRVSVCGYAFTANWRYATSADGGTGNVDAWISSILSADCEFLEAGVIDANTLQVKRTLVTDARAWDLMAQLAALGDASGNMWRLWIGAGRRLYYRQFDVSPVGYLRRGDIYTAVGQRVMANPWTAQPGIYRDAEYPVRRAEPGSPWLEDARDILVEEVEASESGVQLRTGAFSEGELLAAQVEMRG